MAITRIILEFLYELKKNNNARWMQKNIEYYHSARVEFTMLVQELIDCIGDFDTSITALRPERMIYSLKRDARNEMDTAPYNAAFSAHISAAGRGPIPCGYYICVRPRASFLGGGILMKECPAAIDPIRRAIVTRPDDFVAILAAPSFANTFQLSGEKLASVPKGYDPQHPLAEYLKYKSWDIEYPVSDAQLLLTSNVAGYCADIYVRMKPLNDFLNRAVAGHAPMHRL